MKVFAFDMKIIHGATLFECSEILTISYLDREVGILCSPNFSICFAKIVKKLTSNWPNLSNSN